MCVLWEFCVFVSRIIHSGADQRSHKVFMADSCRNLGKTMTVAISSFLVLEGLDPLPEHELMWLRGYFLPEITS